MPPLVSRCKLDFACPIICAVIAFELCIFVPTGFGAGCSGSLSFTPSEFGPKIDFPTSRDPAAIAIGDLDGDGKPEIVVAGFSDVQVFQNHSSPGTLAASSFAAALSVPGAIGGMGVVLADFDGDGRLDIACAVAGGVSVFRNTSTGSSNLAFGPRVDFIYGALMLPNAIAAGDLDGDGKPEIVFLVRDTGLLQVLRNISTPGQLTTASFAAPISYNASGASSVAIGDLDGDGKLDLIASGQNIFIFLNASFPGQLSFNWVQNFTAFSTCNGAAALGDIDNDGLLDMIFPDVFGTVMIQRNLSSPGNIDFAAPQAFPAGPNPQGLTLGDLDVDGHMDFAVVNFYDATISLVRNLSQTGDQIDGSTILCPSQYDTNPYPFSAVIGDLDGDGLPEVLVANVNSSSLSVYPNRISRTVGVALVAPLSGAIYRPPVTVPIQTAVSGSTGSIERVEFYVDSVKIGESTTSPYQINWTPTIAGHHLVQAKAVNLSGASAWSGVADVFVNQLPFVTLISPADQDDVPAGSDVVLNAQASDQDGTIVSVSFYDGPNLLASNSSPPFQWTVPRISPGVHAFTAHAKDDIGESTSTSVTTIVVPNPLTVIRQPSSRRAAQGTTVGFAVEATGIAPLSYQWLVNGTALPGETSRTLVLENVQTTSAGRYSVRLTAAGGSVDSTDADLQVVAPGVKLWEFSAGAWIGSSPAVAPDGTIYVSSGDGILTALDDQGRFKWDYRPVMQIAVSPPFGGNSPAVDAGGVVYIFSADYRLHALNPDGSVRWILGGQNGSEPPAIGMGGTVYAYARGFYLSGGVSYYGAVLTALDPSGSVLWSKGLGSFNDDTGATLNAAGDVFAIASTAGFNLVSVDSGGNLRWTAPATIPTSWVAPVLGVEGRIYIAPSPAFVPSLICFSANGTQLWTASSGRALTQPSIGPDGTIYIGQQSAICHATAANGTAGWTFGTTPNGRSTPAIAADGTLYVGSEDGKLYALGSDGSIKWNFDTGSFISGSSPAVAPNGTVYIGAGNGKLYAVQGSTGLAQSPSPMYRNDAAHSGRVSGQAPQIAITIPSEGAVIPEGTDTILSVNVQAGIAALSRVEFYDGPNLLGKAIASPFSLVWTNGWPGSHRLVAIAVDNTGASGRSIDVQAFVSNGAPSFLPGPDVSVVENSGSNTFSAWANSIRTGPLDDPSQRLRFFLTSDNPTLFAVAPAIDINGTLSFVLAANTHGVAQVTVVLRDDGGTASGGRDTSAPYTFSINTLADSDGDQIPDAFEILHGLNLADASDASEDSDGDGFSNLAEYVAGTDPHDASSAPQVSDTMIIGWDVCIEFPTVIGRHYWLERKSNLSPNTGVLTGMEIVGNGTVMRICDPNAALLPERVYAIHVGF